MRLFESLESQLDFSSVRIVNFNCVDRNFGSHEVNDIFGKRDFIWLWLKMFWKLCCAKRAEKETQTGFCRNLSCNASNYGLNFAAASWIDFYVSFLFSIFMRLRCCCFSLKTAPRPDVFLACTLAIEIREKEKRRLSCSVSSLDHRKCVRKQKR